MKILQGRKGSGGADGGGCFRSRWDVVVLCQLKGCVSGAHVNGAGLLGSLLRLPVALLPLPSGTPCASSC